MTRSILHFFQKDGLKITYKKGHQFFRPEDSAQGIYYLKSGHAILCSTKTGGHEQLVAIGEEGTIFGKVGSVLDQPSVNISAQSITDCVVYRLSCQKFQQLLETEPIAFKAYMHQVSRNNVYLLSQTLILGERDIYSRVIAELLFLAEFHGDKLGNRCTLRVKLTQEEFANMLCISREYLSKTLKKMRLKKLITDQKDKLEIPDLSALQTEMGTG